MKKNLIFLYSLLYTTNLYASSAPTINCAWLPWCNDQSITSTPDTPWVGDNIWIEVISSLVWEAIQFVALIAVIALMISWIMYLVSGGDDEKAKKAKTWIIWSLLWVIISISAWWIINLLNTFYIW